MEAACHGRIRRERLGHGEPHAAVDALIESAHTLTQTMALALFGDAGQGGRVLAGLNNRYGTWAGGTFQACQQAVHGAAGPALKSMVDATERLAGRLR